MSRHITFILALLFCTYSKTLSQLNEYKYIHKFSVKNGLSSFNVRKILQDEFGYIWVATQDGLNRFDGRDFIQYTRNASNQFKIKATDFRDLVLDSATHTMWVLSGSQGLFSINTTTGSIKSSHTSIPYATLNSWSNCLLMSKTDLWIGGLNSLKIYNTVTNEWYVDPILSLKKDKLSTYNIGGLIKDLNGYIWVFVDNYGFILYDPITKEIIDQKNNKEIFNKKNVQGVNFSHPIQNTDSSIIVGTNFGPLSIKFEKKYYLSNSKFSYSILGGLSQPVYSSFLGSQNEVYMGFANRLICFSKDLVKYTIIKDKDGFGENTDWLGNVRTIWSDKDFVWVGSKEGLAYFAKISYSKEIYCSNNQQFSDFNHIYDVQPINDKEIVVGGKNGLYLLNRETQRSVILKKDVVVNNIFQNFDGKLIVATTSGPYVLKNEKLIPLYTEYKELRDYSSSIFLDNIILNDSVTILSTDDEEGMLIWNHKSQKTSLLNSTTRPSLLSSNTINKMYMAIDGTIWILGDKGITIFNKDLSSSKLFTFKDNSADDLIGPFFDITEDDNFFWICAYGKGLLQVNKNLEIVKIYNEDSGLTNNGLYKMFNYKNDFFYLTSNNGLTVFDIEKKIFQKIYEECGLHANTFEEAAGCIFKNELFIGGPNGFCIIDIPSAIKPKSFPKIFLNRILISNRDSTYFDRFSNNFNKVLVPNDATQTQIKFSGIDYLFPDRVHYAYRINELHENWISMGNQNFISLIEINPGTYHLEVKAANEDDVWSAPKTLTLIFEPKWYQTSWFYMSLVLTVTTFLYALYRYRMAQINKQHQIRKEIATDLHDDIGSTLNSVKIYAHLAETVPDKQQYFDLIKNALKQASVGLRDMIWVLDDKNDTVEELFSRLKQFANPLAMAVGIKLDFIIEDSILKQSIDKAEKRNLLLIAKEAINNSIKYAACKNIQVSFFKTSGHKTLRITDDGRGFSHDAIAPGNGLKNMQERAKQIHYAISIDSANQNGTIITVRSF